MEDSFVIGEKQLVVVGDRLLVSPVSPEDRTRSGLYLPDSAIDGKKVSSGWVEAVGPGYAVPQPGDTEEPWKRSDDVGVSYIPLQARKGDYAIYISNSAYEINIEDHKYYVVPNGAVLVLLREDWRPTD